MPKFSQETLDYFRDYLAWAEAGARAHPEFKRCFGLRLNAPSHEVRGEINEFFNDDKYPFGGYWVYRREADEGLHHLNPQRLAFLRQALNTQNTYGIAIQAVGSPSLINDVKAFRSMFNDPLGGLNLMGLANSKKAVEAAYASRNRQVVIALSPAQYAAMCFNKPQRGPGYVHTTHGIYSHGEVDINLS